MKKVSFLRGSILMAAINFFISIAGFSYDVMLSKLVRAEGMGLFQMAMPVLMIFLVVSTAGIPTAISKLVAEYDSKNDSFAVDKIFKAALLFTLVLSAGLSLTLILTARYISLNIFKNHTLLPCLYFLAPAISIISITSAIRGYYYGLKLMVLASASEIIEHAARFVIILSFLHYIYPSRPVYNAIIAICGISIGEFFDLLWLISIQKRRIKRPCPFAPAPVNTITILIQLLKIAAPLTVSSLSNVLLQFANAVLIPQRLMAAGYAADEALAVFGRMMGMVMPLIFLPFIITSAVVVNIIPNLSEQLCANNYKNAGYIVSLAMKITFAASIPLAALYIIFPDPLALLLYNDPEAAGLLRVMGGSTVFLALQHTLSGILNASGKQMEAASHRLAGIILQLAAVNYLVGNPGFGIYGYAAGFFLYTLVICLLDFFTLWKMEPALLKAHAFTH